jgi:hypothetical protein
MVKIAKNYEQVLPKRRKIKGGKAALTILASVAKAAGRAMGEAELRREPAKG